jgi:hypothetical protein
MAAAYGNGREERLPVRDFPSFETSYRRRTQGKVNGYGDRELRFGSHTKSWQPVTCSRDEREIRRQQEPDDHQ